MTSELVKSVSIDNLVNQRTAVILQLSQALDLLLKAEELAKHAHIGFPRLVIDNSFSLRGSHIAITGEFSKSRVDVETSMRQVVDSDGWKYLMDESGLRTFMDATARREWYTQLSNGDVPELTSETVSATFGALYASRGDMFDRGVLQCFRNLSWNYKTNQPFKFGKRIIVKQLFDRGFSNNNTIDALDDLSRVFHVLDGNPEPDHRRGTICYIHAAIENCRKETDTPYFHLKWFKNGNGHLTFTRPDLVERINQILAKHHPDALAADHRRKG